MVNPDPLEPETTPNLRPFSRSLPMALLRAREAVMQQFRPLLAAYDLTEQQWRVLRALRGEKSVTAGELADRTFLLGPSLSRILTALEDRKLVIRTTATDDQRRSLLSLSGRGEHIVAQIAPRSEAVNNQIEDWFGRDRLARLLAELDHLSTMPPMTPGADQHREQP